MYCRLPDKDDKIKTACRSSLAKISFVKLWDRITREIIYNCIMQELSQEEMDEQISTMALQDTSRS